MSTIKDFIETVQYQGDVKDWKTTEETFEDPDE